MELEKLEEIEEIINRAKWFASIPDGLLSDFGVVAYKEHKVKVDMLIRAWEAAKEEHD
uniref:Uncharacterized protein n=1 Tax=viral metagenome TaxID=1070528 RepID=A0A6M3JLN4_9ZZZZ